MLRKLSWAIILLSAALLVDAQVVTRTRTRTRTRIIPGQTQTITLSGGQILTIDSATLQRLQRQGVDINNLQNLSEADLERLGITLRTDTINVPGAVVLEGGVQQITLRNGIILTIDQETLQRLQSQGIDINTLPSLNEEQLRRIGIVLSTETVTTGIRLVPGTTRTITLTDGQIITVEYETLLRLQEQGIDIDNLQALSERELERLGLIVTTRRVTAVARPITTNVTRTVVTAQLVPVIPEEEAPLPAARPSPRPVPRQRPPPPPARMEPRDEEEPAPEPYSFAYTADNEDGSSSTHEATQTAEGVVTGFYILRGSNGEERRVDYIADKDGYRATVTTNEIGTVTGESGDAQVISSAPTVEELARQWQEEQERSAPREQGRSPLPSTRRQQRRRQQRPPNPPETEADRPNIEILRLDGRSSRIQAAPSRIFRARVAYEPAPAAAQTFGVKI